MSADGTGEFCDRVRSIGGRAYRVICQPIRDSRQQLIRVLVTFLDITEEQRREAAMTHTIADLAAEDEARRTFLSTVSHELRTPLNAIIGFSNLMRDDSLASEQRTEFSESIYRSGRTLLQIINNILDFSQLQSAMLRLHPEPVKINDVLDDLERMFRPRAAEKQLELEFIRPAAAILRLDEVRFRQILTNLLGNAVKFTAQGGIVVRVEINGVAAEVCSLRISVADTGVGIPENRLERVFDPFRNGPRGEGGLGLAIARKLTELMGGTLAVHSTPGSGSVFTLEIPRLEQVREMKHLPEGGPPAIPKFAPASVLVVDDVPTNQLVLAAVLKRFGLTVVCASSAAEAIQLLGCRRFDCVMTDLIMPEMDGRTLARMSKGDPAQKGVPVIMVTAEIVAAMNFDRALFEAALLKPITLENIWRILGAFLKPAESPPDQAVNAEEGEK